ncbi:hypothetical protein TorRG33x02_286630 [Trema orientale]|uniref:Uncharacterized protein n=1 Tax=Trema orientale TaxID=63057 RepID=A0A2P5CFN0_TREOI|nr:hypothetical protein TorRG33x02_286630 [Trema orientale]
MAFPLTYGIHYGCHGHPTRRQELPSIRIKMDDDVCAASLLTSDNAGWDLARLERFLRPEQASVVSKTHLLPRDEPNISHLEKFTKGRVHYKGGILDYQLETF